jgi:hypothetical protein
VLIYRGGVPPLSNVNTVTVERAALEVTVGDATGDGRDDLVTQRALPSR